jgi:hypothetical protein
MVDEKDVERIKAALVAQARNPGDMRKNSAIARSSMVESAVFQRLTGFSLLRFLNTA